MKLGALFLVYIIFGIWTSVNRATNVLAIIAIAAICCLSLSLLGRLIRSDRMVTFWHKKFKFLLIVGGIGLVSAFTWNPLMKLIF